MAAKTDDKVEGVREQDKFLPIANISRIMKEALPQNAKISKDAKELVQQCVSDFIIFITMESKHGQRERTHLSRASDKCQREKRKTVNGDDILWAMKSLGFEDAVVVLTTYLQKIREAEGAEKSAKSAAADSRDGAAGSMGTATPNMTMAPGAVPPGYVAYAPMPMQGVPGQQVGSVPGQSMQQPMVMYMPIPGGNNGHMVSMPMSAPMAQTPGQPPGPNQS